MRVTCMLHLDPPAKVAGYPEFTKYVLLYVVWPPHVFVTGTIQIGHWEARVRVTLTIYRCSTRLASSSLRCTALFRFACLPSRRTHHRARTFRSKSLCRRRHLAQIFRACRMETLAKDFLFQLLSLCLSRSHTSNHFYLHFPSLWLTLVLADGNPHDIPTRLEATKSRIKVVFIVVQVEFLTSF